MLREHVEIQIIFIPALKLPAEEWTGYPGGTGLGILNSCFSWTSE